jgi:hypothetical protein
LGTRHFPARPIFAILTTMAPKFIFEMNEVSKSAGDNDGCVLKNA